MTLGIQRLYKKPVIFKLYLKEAMTTTVNQAITTDKKSSVEDIVHESTTIARYILERHQKKRIPFMGITKLIKLVYIAHGYYLAKYKKPLINDSIEAWHYGPALRDLYRAIKDAEREKSKYRYASDYDAADEILDYKDTNLLGYEVENVKTLSTEAKEIIDKVIKDCFDYDAIELTGITHSDYTPWYLTVAMGGSRIDDKLIQGYYEDLLKGQ